MEILTIILIALIILGMIHNYLKDKLAEDCNEDIYKRIEELQEQINEIENEKNII